MAHNNETLIKCPYCDHEWQDSCEFDTNDGIHTCGDCGEDFNVVRNIEVTYSTSKIDCKNHDFHIEKFFISKRKFNQGKWTDMPEEKWSYTRIDSCLNCDCKQYIDITKEEYHNAVKIS